jgi:hypothetical protein
MRQSSSSLLSNASSSFDPTVIVSARCGEFKQKTKIAWSQLQGGPGRVSFAKVQVVFTGRFGTIG